MAKSEEEEITRWMLAQLRADGVLYQDEAAAAIEARFGEAFVYENENGNLAIERKVLAAFRELTKATVVWEPGERSWRFREESDSPGRRAD